MSPIFRALVWGHIGANKLRSAVTVLAVDPAIQKSALQQLRAEKGVRLAESLIVEPAR